MGAGIECYDDNGVLTFTSEDYLGRLVGFVYVEKQNGSLNVSGLSSLGTFFYIWVSDGEATIPDNGGWPSASASGDTITWTYGTLGGQTARVSGYLYYGVK